MVPSKKPSSQRRQRRQVEHIRVDRGDGTALGYTVSIGVAATGPDDGESVPERLARADKALYRSKAAGRNRATVAE